MAVTNERGYSAAYVYPMPGYFLVIRQVPHHMEVWSEKRGMWLDCFRTVDMRQKKASRFRSQVAAEKAAENINLIQPCK
jgi:hypothetical protein